MSIMLLDVVQRVVEEKIRVLEGADDCLVSSSGMNSATTMLLALVSVKK